MALPTSLRTVDVAGESAAIWSDRYLARPTLPPDVHPRGLLVKGHRPRACVARRV